MNHAKPPKTDIGGADRSIRMRRGEVKRYRDRFRGTLLPADDPLQSLKTLNQATSKRSHA